MDLGTNIERRRFSADEVQQMVAAGILDADESLELIDGELFMMSPQSPSHRNVTIRVHNMLMQVYGSAVHVQDHTSIALAANSLPEPDIAVVRGSERDYADRLPTGRDLVLLVEVAVSSLARDRAKAKIYARGGVVEYWIIDVDHREVHCYRKPSSDGYGVIVTLRESEQVEVPGTSSVWNIRDLLP